MSEGQIMNSNNRLSEKDSRVTIVCFGHPLLDIMVNVDKNFLSKYGIQSGSVRLARPEELVLFDDLIDDDTRVKCVPGGSAMNTARTLSWICSDIHISYVGALGKDRFGSILKAALSEAKVEPLFEEHSMKATGTCAALILDKERSLLANLGAAVELSFDHFKNADVQRRINEASLYYVEGFCLNTASSPYGLLAVAEHSKQSGKVFCFNLSAPYICSTFRDQITTLMPYIDYMFGTQEDMLAYAAVRWPGEYSTVRHEEHDAYIRAAVSQIAQQLSAASQRTVIATRGCMSTILCYGQTITEVGVMPLAESEIVDLNGAGDAFVGGFLAQLTTSIGNVTPSHLIRSVLVGHEAARNCIKHSGATFDGEPPVISII